MSKILDWFVLKPITALQEQRIGCTAQCPFCGSVCAGGVGCQTEGAASQKHRAEIHMPKVSINQTENLLHHASLFYVGVNSIILNTFWVKAYSMKVDMPFSVKINFLYEKSIPK